MSRAQYLPLVLAAAQRYGIDPQVYDRLINQESGYTPGLVSSAGARGLAQFEPGTAQQYGINPDDPQQAIDGGARLLSDLLQRYGGSYPLALAAYNAGPGAVDQAGGVPNIPETQTYVRNILGGAAMTPPPNTPDPTGGGFDTSGAQEMDPRILDSVVLSLMQQMQAESAKGVANPNDPNSVGADPLTIERYAVAIGDIMKQAANIRQLQNGNFPIGPDPKTGQMRFISAKDYAALPPEQRAQLDAAISNYNGDLQNKYTDTLNKFGLDEFNNTTTAAKNRNAILQQQFQNDTTAAKSNLDWDTANLTQSRDAVNRAVDAYTQARDNASYITDALTKDAGYATTGGKTAFTGNDLGSPFASVMSALGISPDSTLMRFPGVQDINPAGTLRQQQQQLGAQGPLPQTPALQAPYPSLQPPTNFTMTPGAPKLTPPIAPTPYPALTAPQASAGNGPSLAPPYDPNAPDAMPNAVPWTTPTAATTGMGIFGHPTPAYARGTFTLRPPRSR